MQLIPGLNNSISVIAINNKYETLCVLEVMPPQGTNLLDNELIRYYINEIFRNNEQITCTVAG